MTTSVRSSIMKEGYARERICNGGLVQIENIDHLGLQFHIIRIPYDDIFSLHLTTIKD